MLTTSGTYLWSFVTQMFFCNLKKHRDSQEKAVCMCASGIDFSIRLWNGSDSVGCQFPLSFLTSTTPINIINWYKRINNVIVNSNQVLSQCRNIINQYILWSGFYMHLLCCPSRHQPTHHRYK